MSEDPLKAAASAVSRELNADILLINGQINTQTWINLANTLHKKENKRENLLLILVTPGGDPDAAFRIGRCLQKEYNGNVSTYITGWCKSAGTLISLASKRIYIGHLGELGPLDIQIAKHDELFESSSGLLVATSLETLETTAVKMFINSLVGIRAQIGRGITTRTASELAASMVADLLKPIYSQIDPARIGEDQRAMNITKHYGTRLALRSGILKSRQSLDFLVSAYPDHGFVIDYDEACSLFTQVDEPTKAMEQLANSLGTKALQPKRTARNSDSADIEFLSSDARLPTQSGEKTNETPKADVRGRSGRSSGNGSGDTRKRTQRSSGRRARGNSANLREHDSTVVQLPSPQAKEGESA